MARFSLDGAASGGRADQVVARLVPGLSVAGARRLIAAGGVRVDGRSVRKGDQVGPGQTVEIDEARGAGHTAPGRRVTPDPAAPLEVLATDPDFVAIAKPPGMPSHPLESGETGTAANALVARFPECAAASADSREGGLVHRLDTGTSGILLAARNAEAWAALRRALADRSCEKIYLAEVHGLARDGESLEPIGRAGRRGARVRVGAGRNPLSAHTSWELLEARAGTSLVRARLSKGRAHQVRAHLAAAGHAIVGDPLYGHDESAEKDQPLRLHAWSIRFAHPRTGQAISIEAPPPSWAKMGG